MTVSLFVGRTGGDVSLVAQQELARSRHGGFFVEPPFYDGDVTAVTKQVSDLGLDVALYCVGGSAGDGLERVRGDWPELALMIDEVRFYDGHRDDPQLVETLVTGGECSLRQ